jgi:hypothetical protein
MGVELAVEIELRKSQAVRHVFWVTAAKRGGT